jgi:putative tryptophan/tyrosine transport system substrate-binding protein
MRRREFIAGLSGAAVWSVAARAQQVPRLRRIGILMPFPPSDSEWQSRVGALRQELQRLGWTRGGNIEFDERWTTDNMDLVRANAANLVELKSDAIVALGSRVIPVLRQLTRTIPIIIPGGADAVGEGYVESLARPGGNVTGFAIMEFSVFGKILETLKQLAPATSRVAMIYNPDNPSTVQFRRLFESFASPLSVQPIIAPIQSIADIERAIEALADQPNVPTGPYDYRASRSGHRHRGASPRASDLYGPHLRDQRRPRFLRRGSRRHISPRCVLCRPYPARGKTRRSAVSAADEIPAYDQPQDREGDRPDDP